SIRHRELAIQNNAKSAMLTLDNVQALPNRSFSELSLLLQPTNMLSIANSPARTGLAAAHC
ncbi:hypothetical protein, partial [Roseibacillus persicicus]|uniref:hypothetical protein n=1 Tax=Roseibacillus persicicus TaxID=454148 RepID=UPI0035EC464B